MNRHATEIQEPSPTPPLPADHVLNSGAVLFPGGFDQHGCPLIVFPVDGQGKLAPVLLESEVVDFINYFLYQHNKKQEKQSLVSVVADLRQASLPTSRFIAETLLLSEVHKRTVHTVYIIQPKKKDVLKPLLKLLMPSKACPVPFTKILLKEMSELSNYIDRSQLIPPLGGYLIYCHQSWVTFIKEINAFVLEFLSVVQRMPICIASLQALSRLPVPSALDELKEFCCTNEEKFRQLRRDLGLDELLRHCEHVVEKLRYPENGSCYQAMAGTALFTHTAFDMLQNYSRITAAVEKVELLWHKAFSKAHIQLQVAQLCDEAKRITTQIALLQTERLQHYKVEIAKDATTAGKLVSEYEAMVYTPGMALVRWAEDVIHTLAEALPLGDPHTREQWVLDLDCLKEDLHSAVEVPHRTLRAVSAFYSYYNKANSWYKTVLHENFLQDLLWGVNGDSLTQREVSGRVPVWKQALFDFLRKNPPPDMEELVQLAQLSSLIPDTHLQQAGKRLSQRCICLQKLLTSSGPVPITDLQVALQWQYEFLRSGHMSHAELATDAGPGNIHNSRAGPRFTSTNAVSRSDHHRKEGLTVSSSHPNLCVQRTGKEIPRQQSVPGLSMSGAISGDVPAAGKPPSLSSFDSGFDGAGSSHLEAIAGREGLEKLSRLGGTRPVNRPQQPQIHEENVSSVSDCEDRREEFDFGSVGNSSRASIQVTPKITVDSLNFEIKVKRSSTSPTNPWLSLPVEDLENSYTVTITQNPPAKQRDLKGHDPRQHLHNADKSSRSQDQPTQTEVSTNTHFKDLKEPWSRGWVFESLNSFEGQELSPIQNVLSSTITDDKDKSNCTNAEVPTLLWDSYDFHHQKQDTCDGINGSIDNLSLNDWDVKEHQGLQEVEKILDRADEILEEEENVLAQEALLDGLLKLEDSSDQRALWESYHQLGVMSTSELAEAGVIGLDGHAFTDSENVSDCRSESSCKGNTPENTSAAESAVPSNRGALLKELREIHVLDELIIEENLKIHELRRSEENLEEKLPVMKPQRLGESSQQRQVFHLQVEKEKKEVEKMEKNLAKEMIREQKLKRHHRKTKRVVKCSIMVNDQMKNLDDHLLCDELLSSSRSQRLNPEHLISKVPQSCQDMDLVQNSVDLDLVQNSVDLDLVQNSVDLDLVQNSVDLDLVQNSVDLEIHEPNGTQALSGPIAAEDGESQDMVHPQVTDTNLDKTCENGSVSEQATLDVPQPNIIPLVGASDPEVFHGGAGLQPLELTCEKELTSGEQKELTSGEQKELTSGEQKELTSGEQKDLTSGEQKDLTSGEQKDLTSGEQKDLTSGEQKDLTPGEHAGSCAPEASLIPEMRPNDGAFDPGGTSDSPPVPKPRKTMASVNGGIAEHTDSDFSTEPVFITPAPNDLDTGLPKLDAPNAPPKPKERKKKPPDKNHTIILSPHVNEHKNNNNSNSCTDHLTFLDDNLNESYEISSSQSSSEQDGPAQTIVSDHSLHTEVHLSPELEIASPPRSCQSSQSPPQSPLNMSGSSDEGRSNGSSEDIPDGLQDCYVLRRSVTRSPVNQPQLNISNMELTDFGTPIVLDTGSGLVKAGFADQDLPTVVFPTIIGQPKYEEIMNGKFERETYIGHEAQHMRGVLALKYPVKNGIVSNWDEMEKIWHHTFQLLRVDPEDHPLLMTEAAMNPRENRQRMVELMFECFNVPFTYIAMQAVLALYAAGRCTGVVFDSGDGVSHSVPVFDGYTLPHAVQRFALAGFDVTMHLKTLLQEQGVCMRTSAEMEIVREIKEKCCGVALNYESELTCRGSASAEMHYTMPDGQVISLSTERFRAPEILFKPELIGQDHYGMHESIFKSVLSSDIDLRRTLLGNIVLSGGNTLLPGLPERLQREIRDMVPSDMGECVRVTSPKDRDFSVWSGGAVLANLPSFSFAWISHEEYEEFGPQIVFRKCF